MSVEVPAQYVCPITMEVMKEPVMDRDGNSYEKVAVLKWIRDHGTSPLTRNPLREADLVPNRALLDSINDFMAKHPKATIPAPKPTAAEEKASSDVVDVLPDVPLALQVIHNDQGDCLVTVIPPETPPGANINRAAVDVVCVVDVSGSMGSRAEVQNERGERESHGLSLLDVVKHAVLTTASMLGAKDRMAIVTFTDTAQLLLPLTFMNEAGRALARAELDKATPLARTNIWDGLQTAMDLLTKEPSGRNASVMLLTDGQPNLNPPRGIMPTLRQYNDRLTTPAAFTVNTFGFGYELDSGLLTEIADACNGGLYVFIPDSGLVGTVFVNTVSNILATACNTVTIDIEASAPVDGLMVQPTKTGGTARLGSLQLGQSRDLSFRVPAAAAKDLYVKLSYSVGGQRHSIVCEKPTVVADSSFIRVHAARDAYCRTLSQLVLEGKPALIDEWLAAYGNDHSPLTVAMAKDMQTEVRLAMDPKALMRWGRHYLPSLMMANKAQQCNNFKDPSVQHYGGKVFKRLQDAGEAAFLKLPPPKPSRPAVAMYGAAGGSRPPPAAPVQMANYYNACGGCVAPQCLVAMGDGTATPASAVRRGDVLRGGAAVACVVATVVPHGTMDMVAFPNGLIVSPYHPMRADDGVAWVFPADHASGKTISYDGDYVYSYVLDGGAAVNVNGVDIVSLGHGLRDDIARHAFLGTDAVREALAKLPGYHTAGRVVVQSFVRDSATNLIVGVIGKDC
jgi:Mg-chelatase subunit ChlD